MGNYRTHIFTYQPLSTHIVRSNYPLSPGVSQSESLKWHFVTWLIPVSPSVHVSWAGANPLSYRWGNQCKTSYGTDCRQRLNAIIIKAIWRRSQLMSLASSPNESYGPATLGRPSLCMVKVPFPLFQMPFLCQIPAHAFRLRLVPSSLPRQRSVHIACCTHFSNRSYSPQRERKSMLNSLFNVTSAYHSAMTIVNYE